MNPQLVLADEPTGNLDTTTGDAMHELLFRLNETHGTTFLVVTHSRDLAEQMPARRAHARRPHRERSQERPLSARGAPVSDLASRPAGACPRRAAAT